jgi:hypothetical protein
MVRFVVSVPAPERGCCLAGGQTIPVCADRDGRENGLWSEHISESGNTLLILDIAGRLASEYLV